MLARIFRCAYRALHRARLAIAESDLRWMEANAPTAIARQRARVLALQARLNGTPRVHHTTAQGIADRGCTEKRGLLT